MGKLSQCIPNESLSLPHRDFWNEDSMWELSWVGRRAFILLSDRSLWGGEGALAPALWKLLLRWWLAAIYWASWCWALCFFFISNAYENVARRVLVVFSLEIRKLKHRILINFSRAPRQLIVPVSMFYRSVNASWQFKSNSFTLRSVLIWIITYMVILRKQP